MPLWYTLAVDVNSKGNSLEIANRLYESGMFDVAEPDFLIDVKAQGIVAATDPEFSKQWGLKNTGQGGGTIGIDINVSNAWLKATGKSVNVAVIDHGLQLNHPDVPNISGKSFDTLSGASPSAIHGNHGMACGGIIGAFKDNGTGIAGVAPDATLISISDRLVTGPYSYRAVVGRQNGTWNSETGYGLVNADAAVQMALQSVNPNHNGSSPGPINEKQAITLDAPASDGKARTGNVTSGDVEFVGSGAQTVKFPVGIAGDGKVVYARVEFSGPVKKEYYSNLAEMLKIVEE